MSFQRLVLSFAVFPLLTLLGAAGAVFPQQRELKSDASDQVDAVLLLDTSGSMLLNDPHRLRDEGARLFVQFLRPGDRLGVIQFSEKASVVRSLGPFETSKLEEITGQISSLRSTGEYTDILSGLKLARDMLLQDPRKQAKPIIILLSDGRMEPDPKSGTAEGFTEQLMDQVVPELKPSGVKIYTLAFSEDADRDLLSELAGVTGGVHWFTVNSEDIHKSYAELFLTVKKPQVVPLGAKAFAIDPDVQEATFYINREEGQDIAIRAPNGKEIRPETTDGNVKWYKGQKFDVVTILQPAVGNWQVSGIAPDEGFATLLTNLKLVSDWPVSIDVGRAELLQARLYEGLRPVALPDMTSAVRFGFQVTPTDRISEPIVKEWMVDDGTHGDKVAADGIYSYSLALKDPGEYKLRIISKAPTFERQQQIPFRVKPELVSLKVVAPDEVEEPDEAVAGQEGHESHAKPPAPKEEVEKEPIESGGPAAIIQVDLSDEAKTLKNIQVKVVAIDVQRNRYVLPLSRSNDVAFRYTSPASVLPHDGKYEFQASLSAEDKNRSLRKENSRTVEFTRSSEGGEEEQPAEVVVERPVKKEPEGPPFPWFDLIIALACSGGATFFALKMLKNAQGEMVTEVPVFPIPDAVLKAVEEVEKLSSLAEVDLSDPMFNDEPPAHEQQQAQSEPAAEPETEEVQQQ